MVTVLLLKVFTGPTAALPATVFLNIVVIAVYNFRFFRGSNLCVFLRFRSVLLGFRFLILEIRSVLGSVLFLSL